MTYVADLHLHSPYARGTSPSLSLEALARGAAIKGIDLLATGDFTHPEWLRHLKETLVPTEDGLFTLPGKSKPRFVLGTELSCVYADRGRSRRLHLLVFAPDFEAIDRLCEDLAPYGDLASDGRPTLSLSARDTVETVLAVSDRCEVVPAHIWTPWYSVYGSKAGYESMAECFGDMLPFIHAVETGLSSDPAMNWRVPELDNMAIVSFSDAHSLPRLGRELTVFEGTLSYDGLLSALRDDRVAYTVEFYPEEGKYHYDGHRKCGVCQHPSVTMERGVRCPKCRRPLTLGVLHRTYDLSQREPVSLERSDDGMLHDPSERRPPFRRLVPLEEVIAEALSRKPAARIVQETYQTLVQGIGSELRVLESADREELAALAGDHVADGIVRARQGAVSVSPGYDGVYGSVSVWGTPDSHCES